jgi:molecular chaperone Hsp33
LKRSDRRFSGTQQQLGEPRNRAFARFDAALLAQAQAQGGITPAALLGSGHLAFTIEQGEAMSRYQGVVALAGQGLEEAAHEYFRQSEQIPTLVRLAVAESVTGVNARHVSVGRGMRPP